MMKKIYSICVLAVFTVLLTLVSGCVDNLQTDPEEMIQGQEGTFVLTIKASKAITTKALNHPDEHNIISTWTQNEEVTVYNETKGAVQIQVEDCKAGIVHCHCHRCCRSSRRLFVLLSVHRPGFHE